MGNKSPSYDDICAFIETAANQMKSHGLTSIDVEQQGTRIRLRRSGSNATSALEASESAVSSEESTRTSGEGEYTRDELITAPMIGTFYSSAAPGEAPLVERGDEIEIGQVIGIIEAMKIMNEITSDRSGVVEEILVSNAEAVEFGQALMRVVPRSGG